MVFHSSAISHSMSINVHNVKTDESIADISFMINWLNVSNYDSSISQTQQDCQALLKTK